MLKHYILLVCLFFTTCAERHLGEHDHNHGDHGHHHGDDHHNHGDNGHNHGNHGDGDHAHHHNRVEDRKRECPDGFFYAGEVPEVTRGEVWSKGETSPVYSCYSIFRESLDWVAANQKCFEQKGQLLSINNNQEEAILTGDLFMNYLQEVEIEEKKTCFV